MKNITKLIVAVVLALSILGCPIESTTEIPLPPFGEATWTYFFPGYDFGGAVGVVGTTRLDIFDVGEIALPDGSDALIKPHLDAAMFDRGKTLNDTEKRQLNYNGVSIKVVQGNGERYRDGKIWYILSDGDILVHARSYLSEQP